MRAPGSSRGSARIWLVAREAEKDRELKGLLEARASNIQRQIDVQDKGRNPAEEIQRLHEAKLAGHPRRYRECTMRIVTEGDGALALVVDSLSNEQRQFYGAMPLSGKAMNCLKNRSPVGQD